MRQGAFKRACPWPGPGVETGSRRERVKIEKQGTGSDSIETENAPAGNQSRPRTVFPYANEISTAFWPGDRDFERRGCTGTAVAGNPARANRAAVARSRHQLCPDAAGIAARPCLTGGCHHGPAGRAARRKTGEIGRRAMSARRHRPGNPRPNPRHRQDAGDSAARQPRRRPHGPPEIAPLCRHFARP